MARHRLRFPAIDSQGNRIGTIVIAVEGELPEVLDARFVAGKAASKPWSLERDPEADPTEDNPESPPESRKPPGYPVFKRTHAGHPFTFLLTEGGPAPKVLVDAAKHYGKDLDARIVVIGAWDGRLVVPLFEALTNPCSLFTIDPVFPRRTDLVAQSVPPSEVVNTLSDNLKRSLPSHVTHYGSPQDANQLGRTLDNQDAHLIVVAAEMPVSELVTLAENWKPHLREGGAMLGVSGKTQLRDQVEVEDRMKAIGLAVTWNQDGTVWRAK